MSTLRYNHVTDTLHCITSEVRDFPHYDGSNDLKIFLGELKRYVPADQRFHVLDIGLHAPAIWWETHKENMGYWEECAQMMQL